MVTVNNYNVGISGFNEGFLQSNTASVINNDNSNTLKFVDTLSVSSMVGGLGGGVAGGLAGSLSSINPVGVVARVLNKLGVIQDITFAQSANAGNIQNFNKTTITTGNNTDIIFATGKNQDMNRFAQFKAVDNSLASLGEVPPKDLVGMKAVQQNGTSGPVKVTIADSVVDEISSTGNETVKKLSDQPLFKPTLGSVASGTLNGAKFGILIGGGVSILSNGIQLLIGKKTGPEALGNITADTVTSGLSAAGGGLVGGLTAFGLASLSMSTAPFMILTAGAGMIGAVAGHYIIQKTGLHDSIKNKVKGLAE